MSPFSLSPKREADVRMIFLDNNTPFPNTVELLRLFIPSMATIDRGMIDYKIL